MSNKILDYIDEHVDEFYAQGAEAERIGRLTDKTVELFKEAGAMRMLQLADYGGTSSIRATSPKP